MSMYCFFISNVDNWVLLQNTVASSVVGMTGFIVGLFLRHFLLLSFFLLNFSRQNCTLVHQHLLGRVAEQQKKEGRIEFQGPRTAPSLSCIPSLPNFRNGSSIWSKASMLPFVDRHSFGERPLFKYSGPQATEDINIYH